MGDYQQSRHQVVVLLVCDLKRRQAQASESSQEALPFLRAESVEPLKFKTCAAQQALVKVNVSQLLIGFSNFEVPTISCIGLLGGRVFPKEAAKSS